MNLWTNSDNRIKVDRRVELVFNHEESLGAPGLGFMEPNRKGSMGFREEMSTV